MPMFHVKQSSSPQKSCGDLWCVPPSERSAAQVTAHFSIGMSADCSNAWRLFERNPQEVERTLVFTCTVKVC